MLDIINLCIEFDGKGQSTEVVHNLNINVKKGEIVGVVGESGSGKTVTALSIAGLLSRHNTRVTGEILLDGTDIVKCDRAALRKQQGRNVSMVFQEPMSSLNPLMKIGRQVEESLRIHTQLQKAERRERAIDTLHSVELPEAVYNMYPHQLSGGMRQRAMIAAALIMNPKLLIADEPTTALDVTIQAQILRLLKKVNEEAGVSILFISHDLRVVSSLCKRVIVMQNGYLVEEGESIFNNPKEEYTKKLIDSIPTRKKRT